MYEQIYDEQGQPIDGLFVDQNQDGLINSDDRVVDKTKILMYLWDSLLIFPTEFSLGLNATCKS